MAEDFQLRIKEIIPRTHNVKSFRLESTVKPDFKAGQYLIVTLNDNENLRKPLSISSSPTEEGYIEFTKKITESEFSKTLDNLKINDKARVKYPYGNFTLKEKFNKIAFLSGGIGITPIRSIIKYVYDKKLDVDIILLYANRTAEDIAFKEDFDLMQKGNPKLKIIHILSQAQAEPESLCRAGRINSQVIREEIPDYNQRKFYLCGPPLMVEVMEKCLLEDLNLAKDSIITEDFKGY